LNELSSADQRRAQEAIRQLCRVYPRIKVAVTSRTTAASSLASELGLAGVVYLPGQDESESERIERTLRSLEACTDVGAVSRV
jgi:hypothetical protein